MRAPQEHGAFLQIPPQSEWDSLWQQNLQVQRNEKSLRFSSWKDLVESARRELVAAADKYSRQHRDVDLQQREQTRVVMSGHQPTLFHAGVWYKNFVLDHLARRFNCVAINLVVDNDVSVSSAVSIPQFQDNTVSLLNVEIDGGRQIVPFEERKISDHEHFKSFGERAAKAIRPVIGSPIVTDLWPLVVANSNDDNFGLAIAKGRHAYEASLGLETLELPISALAQTDAFANFAKEILFRIDEFASVYNSTVQLYRKLNKVRSNSHPVPNLGSDGEWCETPFWIWHAGRPQRKSLYARVVGDGLKVSDRQDFETALTPENFNEQFRLFGAKGIRIRPKALMTTMFSRLIAADLFIHGIGGAKYDQLTDAISYQFFGHVLPKYLTATATMRIQDRVPVVSKSQINQQHDLLRQMTFHPESFVESEQQEVQECIESKRNWIEKQLPQGERKERHREIVACNQQLQASVAKKREALDRNVQGLKELLPSSKLANSREFSFCLFDPALVDELKVE